MTFMVWDQKKFYSLNPSDEKNFEKVIYTPGIDTEPQTAKI